MKYAIAILAGLAVVIFLVTLSTQAGYSSATGASVGAFDDTGYGPYYPGDGKVSATPREGAAPAARPRPDRNPGMIDDSGYGPYYPGSGKVNATPREGNAPAARPRPDRNPATIDDSGYGPYYPG